METGVKGFIFLSFMKDTNILEKFYHKYSKSLILQRKKSRIFYCPQKFWVFVTLPMRSDLMPQVECWEIPWNNSYVQNHFHQELDESTLNYLKIEETESLEEVFYVLRMEDSHLPILHLSLHKEDSLKKSLFPLDKPHDMYGVTRHYFIENNVLVFSGINR